MSKKVLCTLPFAAAMINGIAFEEVEGGMQSVDPVSDEVADNFLSIPGYEEVEVSDAKPLTAAEKKAAAKVAAEADAAAKAEADAAAAPAADQEAQQ